MKIKEVIYRYSLRREEVPGIREGRPLVSGPGAVAEFLRSIGMAEEEQEHLVVLILNTKNLITAYHTVTIGLLDQSQGHPREVFRLAIMAAAARIILAHNHPSGNVEPSAQDIALTRMVKDAGKIIGIQLADHVIIGADGKFCSLCEQGLL